MPYGETFALFNKATQTK